jgi:hypothetical protein
MGDPTGEADKGALWLDFRPSSAAAILRFLDHLRCRLLAYRELNDTLRLTDTGTETLADARTGKNGRHRRAGLLRQSICGRLAGYEDVNDADRLCRDPAMRRVVGDRATTGLLPRPARWAGSNEQYIKEGKNAIKSTRLSCRTFAPNAVRLQLHVLAYNLGNFMRTLAMPKAAEPWSLTSLREKLIKIGANLFSRGRYVTFRAAEVAVSRQIFADILSLIARLRAPPAPA